MHFVYIIYSEKLDLYYKGYTENIPKRLSEHNLGLSRYTSGKGPWVLVYFEEFTNRTDALKREKSLKKCKKEYFQWLIAQKNKK